MGSPQPSRSPTPNTRHDTMLLLALTALGSPADGAEEGSRSDGAIFYSEFDLQAAMSSETAGSAMPSENPVMAPALAENPLLVYEPIGRIPSAQFPGSYRENIYYTDH